MKTSEVTSIKVLIPSQRADKSAADFQPISSSILTEDLSKRTVGLMAGDRFLLDPGKYTCKAVNAFKDGKNIMVVLTVNNGKEDFYTTLGALTKLDAHNTFYGDEACKGKDLALVLNLIESKGFEITSVEDHGVWDWAEYRKLQAAGTVVPGGPSKNGIKENPSKFMHWTLK